MDERRIFERWAGWLQLVAAFGAALFLVGFMVTWMAEPWLRSTAHRYLVREVTERVEEKLGNKAGGVLQAASQLSRLVHAEADSTAERLKEIVPPLVEGWLLEHCACDLTDPQAALVNDLATETAIGWSQAFVQQVKQRAAGLRDFAMGHYDARWNALLRELRIFSFSNAALFLFAFLILKFRPLRARLVVGPLSLLTLATIGAATYWAFGQDWFWTILSNNYLGWGYLGVVGVLFLALAYAALGPSPD